MTAAGWLTMALALALVWSATAWCFWMVLSRPQPEAAIELAAVEVERD